MSFIRFNHVFAMLMVLSVVSAFVLSPQSTNALRAQVQGLFSPVSVPVRTLAAALMHRVVDTTPVDDGAAPGETRSEEILLAENQQLRAIVSNLTQQLQDLQALNKDRQQVGIVRPYCTPVTVAGGDPGTRRTLTLLPAPEGELRAGMPVLYPGGLAGRIERASAASAHVRLLSDTTSRVEAGFIRYRPLPDGGLEPVPIATPTKPLVVGSGKDDLLIRNLSERDVRATEVAVGDWIVLQDPEWPRILQGYPIGRIASISQQPNAPGFSQIVVEPMTRLAALREVMVMNKDRVADPRGAVSQTGGAR